VSKLTMWIEVELDVNDAFDAAEDAQAVETAIETALSTAGAVPNGEFVSLHVHEVESPAEGDDQIGGRRGTASQ